MYRVVGMGSEEERVLENQLELQLHEQRDSLTAIDHALLLDPTNPELLEVCNDSATLYPQFNSRVVY